MKKILVMILASIMVFSFTACGGGGEEESSETVTVNVFAAASLGNVMAEFEASYEEANPGVDIVL